jgi:ABC-2 type transport system ATP-binding protein
VQVLGFDPADRSTSRKLRERLGIVLQECAVEPYLSVHEVLTRNAGYYPRPRRVEEVIELVGLTEKADARVKTLSGGQQRRLDVGLGIIGNPELLFLDEPTTGFDPSARRDAWDLVRSLRHSGTTVILTTHYMDEAEALADRVAIISRGTIVAQGNPKSLGGRDAADTSIRFKLGAGTAAEELPIPVMLTPDGSLEIKTSSEVNVLHRLTGWALEQGVELVGLTVDRPTLEDTYLRLVADQSQDVTRVQEVSR